MSWIPLWVRGPVRVVRIDRGDEQLTTYHHLDSVTGSHWNEDEKFSRQGHHLSSATRWPPRVTRKGATVKTNRIGERLCCTHFKSLCAIWLQSGFRGRPCCFPQRHDTRDHIKTILNITLSEDMLSRISRIRWACKAQSHTAGTAKPKKVSRDGV